MAPAPPMPSAESNPIVPDWVPMGSEMMPKRTECLGARVIVVAGASV
jgi:hypothetical protein